MIEIVSDVKVYNRSGKTCTLTSLIVNLQNTNYTYFESDNYTRAGYSPIFSPTFDVSKINK